ncbi:MAG: T9SS type A sorting domain-containing protein [Bacteroidota bacterium]
MKNYFLLFFFLLLGWNSLFAQLEPVSRECGISFNYDNAGNRIKRFVCMTSIDVEFRTTTEEEQASKPIDLEAMIAESGYSEELEVEIEKLEALLSQSSNLDLKADGATKNQLLELTDQNFSNLSDYVVFPNPAMTSFSIRGDGLNPEATLSILGMDGRVLSQRVLGDGRDIDVSSLPEGAYVLTLVDKNQSRVSMLIKSTQL